MIVRLGSTRVVSPVLRFAGGGTLTVSAGEAVYTPPGGGGGSSDHALLSHLAWTASGHTGTASRLAWFDAAGAAAYLSLGSGLTTSGSSLVVDTSVIATVASLAGYVPTSRTIATTSPLQGGGDLSADRTLSILTASGSQAGALSAADWTTFNAKEPAITAGTTAQYWRGDKTWQTLDKSAVGLGNVENTALSTWAGSTNLTTLGTVTTGTWSATAITTANGGTGLTSWTSGDLPYYASGTALSKVAIGASGYLLGSSGTAPQWRQPSDVRTDLGLVIGTNVQAYDAGLTSLTSADASAGLPYVTAANTWASATYSGMLSIVSAAWKVVGLRESGGTDLSMGAITAGQVLVRSGTTVASAAFSTLLSGYSALLAAIAGLGVNGLIARTAAGTAAARTITSNASQLTVTNGDGVSGNPTLNLTTAVTVTGPVALGTFAGIVGTATTFDGTSAVTNFSLAARVYTASAAAFHDLDMTVDTSGGDVTIVVKGTVLKCLGITVTGSGTATIHFDGGSASGGTTGTGASPVANAALLGGGNGGAGRTTTNNGAPGISVTSGVMLGGLGGAGGASSGNTGGAAGSISRQWAPQSQYGDLTGAMRMYTLQTWSTSSPTTYQIGGGSGGGAGGLTMGGSSAISGAGGGGAGMVAIYARTLATGTATLIVRAKGGNGGNATGGTGNNSSAGGAGGAGGGIVAILGEITGSNAVQFDASGGNGGNGAVNGTGTNAAGGAGGAGGTIGVLYGAAAVTPTTNVAGGTGGTGAGGGATGASGTTGYAYMRLAT